MPNEYISREAAQYKIREQNINPETPFGEGLSAAIDILQGIPAADVAEVVHGEWVAWTNSVQDWYECNLCGGEPLLNDSESVCLTKYCSHCGALMDGGDHHD